MSIDKTFDNTAAKRNDYVESELNKFGENDFESAVNVTEFVNDDGNFVDNTSKSHEEFNFNNCILEICDIIKNLSQVDKSKYVKVFEKDGEHAKIKALARKKSAKLSPIPQSAKRYPKEVKSGIKTFTKPGAISSVGSANTTSGYCLLINIKDLSMEARERILDVLQKDDHGLETNSMLEECGLSQDLQTANMLNCSVCEYACLSWINLDSHIKTKHTKKESPCTTCGKQINEGKLAEHNKEYQKKNNKSKRKSSSTDIKKSNCYLVFVEEKRPILKTKFPMLTSIQVTQKLSEEWQSLTKVDKQLYRLKSAELNKEHKESNMESSCPMCGERFPDQAMVIKHLVARHVEVKHEPTEKTIDARCNLCHIMFLDIDSLSEHMNEDHTLC
jgi:predicted RNA-binding Zn-ribbon protein involved in translation (DUF1610 family)